jgi:hypothetical protein
MKLKDDLRRRAGRRTRTRVRVRPRSRNMRASEMSGAV